MFLKNQTGKLKALNVTVKLMFISVEKKQEESFMKIWMKKTLLTIRFLEDCETFSLSK